MKTKSFLPGFMLLTVFGGVAIGMSRIITTFYALELGASNAQIGYISAFEGLGRFLVILPAGFIIARYGAALVYAVSSLIPAFINVLLPLVGVWYGVAFLRGVMGLAIPFRMLSMNSSFLQKLDHIGVRKAGWHRSAQSLGVMVLGPVIASFLTGHFSYLWCYLLVAAMFLLMTFYGSKVLPESEEPELSDASNPFPEEEGIRQQIKNIWQMPAIRESCIVEFICSTVFAVFTTFIIVLALTVASLSQAQAVMLVTIQGFTIVLVGVSLGYFLSRFRLIYVQQASAIFAVGGLLLIGLSEQFCWLVVGTVLLNLGIGLINMVKTIQLSRLNVSKSKVSGVFNLFNMGGALFGAVSGGLLADWLGLSALFLFWVPVFIGMAIWSHIMLDKA